VARLAGVPPDVLARARAILADVERDEDGLARRILAGAGARSGAPVQLGLFSPRSPVEDALAELDVERLSPLEALLELKRLQERLG
jgi:DNA mismatch repair protein MutS